MSKVIRIIFLIGILAMAAFIVFGQHDNMAGKQTKMREIPDTNHTIITNTSLPPNKTVADNQVQTSVFSWVGKDAEQLEQVFGTPDRIDKSAYGYDWWIYNEKKENYIQFGIKDRQVVTMYILGDEIYTGDLEIGQGYKKVQENYTLKRKVSYSKGLSSYTFQLTDEDVEKRPLIKWKDEQFLQLYFDQFTNQLVSIRVSEARTLLSHRPYEIVYTGKLPETEKVSASTWNAIESGMEKQIYDITNLLREKYGKSTLQHEDSASVVALNHSRDMYENDYFSHTSLNGNGLKERLENGNVDYYRAGENIAAHYPDAPAAVIGWLNSEGHRRALLNEAYTHIGIGVYRLYYTQNFIGK